MAPQSERLPARFPVGTKLVIEDRRTGTSHGYAQYLVFPDGRCIDVPAATARAAVKPGRRRSRR